MEGTEATRKHKILELFCGPNQSFSRVARSKGHETFTVDMVDYEGVDYVVNVLDLDYSRIPFKPTIIWCSPDCTTYSVAGIRHHRINGITPISERAVEADKSIIKMWEIIKHFKPEFFFIENPRGCLRNQPTMKNIHYHYYRSTVTYCQYDYNIMKPTDIWYRSTNWKPRPMCKNGDPCHEAAPRGEKNSGLQKLSKKDRNKIPLALCEEIIRSCEK